MPILDQGYQHWKGQLGGHAWRWLAITRQGVRAQARNRWVWALFVLSCIPALVLSAFLVLWGLFEQKSALLTPLLMFLQGLPDELRAGPRGFRTTFWTLAFDQFLTGQVYTSMLLVLLVGPELISQDLRFNAMPLYFSRPVRRLDYFAGKLGVVAVYLSVVTIVPVLMGYCLGVAFSLDPLILRDTWRVLAGSLLFAVIVVASAGTLILAISSLSRNSRYVGALWIGIWIISETSAGVLFLTIHRPWCPLLSYTANLSQVREALLDTPTAREKVVSLFQAGQDQFRRTSRPGPFGRGRVSVKVAKRPAPLPPPPPSAPTGDRDIKPAGDQDAGESAPYSWRTSAAILAGLGFLSLWVLASRVRSLDRLR
jgi:ABC-2 type transport system permease protein